MNILLNAALLMHSFLFNCMIMADPLMISITGETDCGIVNFLRVLCYVMIFALVYAVVDFFESVEFKLHSS